MTTETLSFTLRVHRLSQTFELADNICKHYFGQKSTFTYTSDASLSPDDAESAIFTVRVYANLVNYIPDAEEAAAA